MKKQKTWETLEVGDELRHDDNDFSRWVLGILGRVIFVSEEDNEEEYSGGWTKEELIETGYTIVQDKEEEVNKEEDLKKLIEKTIASLTHTAINKKSNTDDVIELLYKWKGVEVEKIKYIK